MRPTTRPIIVGPLMGREPPRSIEAEMSLIGAVVLEPAMLEEVLPIVGDGSAFSDARLGAIYATMLRLYEGRKTFDLVQLKDELERVGEIESVGIELAVECAEAVPAAANAVFYARIVAEKARLRNLAEALGRGLHDVYHMSELSTADDVIGEVEARVLASTERRSATDAVSLKQLASEEAERIAAHDGVDRGLMTGYIALDDMLGGMQPGDMVILAARPSMGKTALAINIAENVAGRGVPTLVFSLEMSGRSLVQRLLSDKTQVSVSTLRRAKVDFVSLANAADKLGSLPIEVDDTSGIPIHEMRARARRDARRRGTGLIVIDYLQLVTASSRTSNRQEEVGSVSRGIKAMAMELGVPVLCLAQLNRNAEHRDGNRPRMSDLRDSGSIEQDADVVILLHREEYYNRSDPNWALANPDSVDLAELIVSKHRNGATGTVNLTWDSRRMRFENRHSVKEFA